MAMPEPPEGYEWEVSLGNAPAVPGFRARAFVRMVPAYGQVHVSRGLVYGPVPVYDEGFEAIEAVAAQMAADKETADELHDQREQTAREWAEALGCKVTA